MSEIEPIGNLGQPEGDGTGTPYHPNATCAVASLMPITAAICLLRRPARPAPPSRARAGARGARDHEIRFDRHTHLKSGEKHAHLRKIVSNSAIARKPFASDATNWSSAAIGLSMSNATWRGPVKKPITALALATLIVSPALAQSYEPEVGSGNIAHPYFAQPVPPGVYLGNRFAPARRGRDRSTHRVYPYNGAFSGWR